MLKNKKHIFIPVLISFTYILIGTYDNLTGLNFEKYLKNLVCENADNFCELYLFAFYSQSYLYGAILCGFFGTSDLAFIICQLFIWMIFFFFIYLIFMLIGFFYSKFRLMFKKK